LGHSGKAVALFSIEPAPVREERTEMLRIHIHQRDGGMTFTLEGRLIGPWVKELEKCWQDAISAEPQSSILVNLACVSFVDSEGKELLTRMRRRGVGLASSGVLMNAIVDEIEHETRKRSPAHE